MGNCLNLLCFHDDPPLLPSSDSMKRRISSVVTRHEPSSCKRRPSFMPLLPFPTPSNLSVLYVLGPELGRGQFGIIRSCTSVSSGALFACKSIPKLRLSSRQDIDDVICEIRIMKHLSRHSASSDAVAPHSVESNNIYPHEAVASGNIVRLQEVIEDEEFVHLIMEICRGGELFDRIVEKKWYSEVEAAPLMKSLLESVQFCHKMGIIHRDLKPENILLIDESDASSIKLADFGLAVEFSPGQKFSGIAGSAYYIAPEVLQGEYSEEIDVWSAGVIMYVLLSGVPPFWGPTEQGIFKAIQEGELDFQSDPWGMISASGKDLISQMLHPDAKSRLTAAQALKHPWICDHAKVASKVTLLEAYHTNQDIMGSSNSQSASETSAPVSNTTSSSMCHIRAQHDDRYDVPHDNGTQIPATVSSMAFTPAVFGGLSKMSSANPELRHFLAALLAGLDRKSCSLSDSLAKMEVQAGWSCTVLTVSSTEETMMVDMGQEKYLVAHDRRRKRIGWRVVKQQRLRHKNARIVPQMALDYPHHCQPVY